MITPRLCLFFLLFFSLVTVKAQFILNGGFEDSTITVNDTVPTYWSMDYFGASLTPDAHAGLQAMSVWNWYSYARGWLVYGDATSSSDGGGQPVSVNPTLLSGYYKYIYGDNGGAADSAICEILIYSHQNFTGARDTIAHVIARLGPQPEYVAFAVPITYIQPGIVADTIVVRFISSQSGFCNPSNECLYLYVDDIEVSTITGVSQSLDVTPPTTLYPSPSSDGFQIHSSDPSLYPCELVLYDYLGSKVFAQKMDFSTPDHIHPALATGQYLWTITTENGKKYSGKWSKE